MTELASFFPAILDAPDDDVPRLVCADWLSERDDPRGEFIRVQVQLAHIGRNHPNWLPLLECQHQLLSRHWNAWVGPLRQALRPGDVRRWEPWLYEPPNDQAHLHFRRGFVERLALTAQCFTETWQELYRATPLHHLRLTEVGEGLPIALAQCPGLEWLSTLEFLDQHRQPLNWAQMRVLAASPHLRRLRRLNLYHANLGDAGVAALASADWLAQVHWLNLSWTGLSGPGLQALAESGHLGQLRELHLRNVFLDDTGAAALAGCADLARLRVLSLDHSTLTPAGLEALGRSPALAQLETLSLEGVRLGEAGLSALARANWRHLTTLNLARCRLGPEIGCLAEWPGLRSIIRLNLAGNDLGVEGIETLAQSRELQALEELTLDPGLSHWVEEAYWRSGRLPRLRAIR